MSRLALHRYTNELDRTDTTHDTHVIALIDPCTGLEAARYARTLHPLFRREGYTIDPPHIKGRSPARSYYVTEMFKGRHLDPYLQRKLYIDPDLPLTGDEKENQPSWPALGQIIEDLEPLLDL